MDKKVLRIDINYAFEQSGYWMSCCALSSFTVIYLTYRGLTNTQIGITTSISSILAIVVQLFLSSYMDKHMEIPVKRVISILFLIAICLSGLLHLTALPVAGMIIAYAAATSMNSSNSGYLNAQMMQFNNMGIPAHYGWPRGIGSMSYAIAAYVYGVLVEKYTPEIVLPVYIAGALVTIVCVMLMPNPYKDVDPKILAKFSKKENQTNYIEMIKGNWTLVFLLVAIIINNIGSTASYTYSVRIIEELGGTTAQYGTSEFIRAAVELPMLFASGFLLKHFRAKTLVQTSFLANASKAIVLGLAPSVGFVYLSSVTNMFGVGLSAFSFVVFVNSIVRMNEKVRAQSLIMLCASVGSIIGSLFSGMLIDHIGTRPVMFISSFFCICAFLIMLLFCREKTEFTPGAEV